MNRSTTWIKTGINFIGRKYPRFLYSDPQNTKSEGPFIIHTLEPRFIARVELDKKRNIIGCRPLEIWTPDHDLFSIQPILAEIPTWFRQSGIHQSSHHKDKLISEISKIPQIADNSSHYTVDQARQVIRILFPTKAKTINRSHSSYGLKHFLEHISSTIINDGLRSNKYCSNQTMLKAFEEEKFQMVYDGPNAFMNIAQRELRIAYELFWNY